MRGLAKYRNVKTVVDGITFDSKREAKRYGELKLLERAGELVNLQTQVPFDLVVNGTKVCKYIADFKYLTRQGPVVEDVKSEVTRREPLYRLKCKLMKACHGIEIREVL